MIDVLDMLRDRIEFTDDCWLWRGSLHGSGYGQIELRVGGQRRHWLAHRLVYTLLVGEPGENLHHRETCPKACVNPAHLTPLTIADHTAHHSTKIICSHGHDLADAYIVRRSNGTVCRQCRPCKLARAKAYKIRKKASK